MSKPTLYICALAASLLAAGCYRSSYADTKAQSPPPPITTAVGPVPGPDHHVPFRRNPYFENRDARAAGRKLFIQFNCSGCHGGRAGCGMGPSLRDVDWLYGSDDAQIFSSIAEGRAHGMPSWETKLTEDQVWKIVTYIKSLRTKDEVDPPA